MKRKVVFIGDQNRTYYANQRLERKLKRKYAEQDIEIENILPEGEGYSKILNPDEIDVILVLEGKSQNYTSELREAVLTGIPTYFVSNSNSLRLKAKLLGVEGVYTANEFYSKGGIERVISKHLINSGNRREIDPLVEYAERLGKNLGSEGHRQDLIRRAEILKEQRNANAYELLERHFEFLKKLEKGDFEPKKNPGSD